MCAGVCGRAGRSGRSRVLGGEGTQKATVWDAQAIVLGPIVHDDAINEALYELGVEPRGSLDEFATLDLGRCRATEDWLELPHRQGV